MLKCAENSPRVCEDGSIRWYEGDTFELEFDLTFTDDEGNVIETLKTDQISICFRDAALKEIYTYTVTGTTKLVVPFTEDISKLFKVGKYMYCVRRVSNFKTTIMRMNRVIVE